MKKLILLLSLFASPVFADITVEVNPAVVSIKEQTTKVTQLQDVDGNAIDAPITTTSELLDKGTAIAATIQVGNTESKIDDLIINVMSDTAVAKQLSPGKYVVYEPGTHQFLCQTINLDNFRWETKKVVVVVGKPEPPKPPTPPIPDDQFNNLGRRVAEWTSGLSKNLPLVAVYQKGVDDLYSNPGKTIATISNEMNNASLLIRGGDASYNTFVAGINAELTARWPMGREAYAEFLSCIVKGLSL